MLHQAVCGQTVRLHAPIWGALSCGGLDEHQRRALAVRSVFRQRVASVDDRAADQLEAVELTGGRVSIGDCLMMATQRYELRSVQLLGFVNWAENSDIGSVSIGQRQLPATGGRRAADSACRRRPLIRKLASGKRQ